MKNLGTKIERIAKPIARGIDAIWGTDLANCFGCGTMRNNLNAGMPFTQALHERFWPQTRQPTNGDKINMDFNMQIVVENAASLKEACEKAERGELTVIGGQPRPQQVPQGRVVTGGFQSSTTAAIPPLPAPPTSGS